VSSLHKDPKGRSPFFYCAFRGANGKRLLRSTKTADRKLATRICHEWQSASDKARNHELTAVQCRKVLSELLSFSSGEVLVTRTTGVWIRGWVEGKHGCVSPSTFQKYAQVTADFLAHLGNRATAPLTAIAPGDIASFRDGLRASGCSAKTANLARSIISAAFLAALKQGHLAHNPAQAVDSLRIRKAEGREPFSHEELLKLVAEARGDWRGAVLLGATSGLRLGDVAGLRWEAIDLEAGLLSVETQKTGDVVVLPLHRDFLQWLSSQQRGIAKAALFPALSGVGTGGATDYRCSSVRSCRRRELRRKLSKPMVGKAAHGAVKVFIA
jgi:integrase